MKNQEEDDEDELNHHTMGASNNWVIHGKHTKNGKPIIANDPHLGNAVPSNWHLSHLKISGKGQLIQELWGSYFPGAPIPVIGGNPNLTYSMTVMTSDTSDVYEEKIEGENYLFKD